MGNNLILLAGGDFLISYLAFALVSLADVSGLRDLGPALSRNSLNGLTLAVTVLCFSTLAGLYRRGETPRKRDILIRTATVCIMLFFFYSAVYYIFNFAVLKGTKLIAYICTILVLQFFWHVKCHFLFAAAGLRHRAIIMGDGELALQVGDLMSSNPRREKLLGYVVPSLPAKDVDEKMVLGVADDILEIAKKSGATQIVIALSERRGSLPVVELLACKLKGILILDAVTYLEEATGKIMLEHINPSWFIFSRGSRITPLLRLVRRVADIILSLIGLVLAAVLMPFIWLAIKLDSSGPAIFKQKRVGEGEREFSIYKFRTMSNDAEKTSGAVWAKEGDPRVTRVGSFLRKSRLDELPQLFNVFLGDMSFVGPRPERPEFVEMLKKEVPYYGNRHCIKPGLTGWAQVRYAYGASVEDALAKLRYDLFYIKNYTIALDLIIIAETFRVVLFGRGAR